VQQLIRKHAIVVDIFKSKIIAFINKLIVDKKKELFSIYQMFFIQEDEIDECSAAESNFSPLTPTRKKSSHPKNDCPSISTYKSF
jgi:hypothetical protein